MSDKKEPQLEDDSGPKLSLFKITEKELKGDLKYSPTYKKSDIKFLLEVYDCVYGRLENIAEKFYKNRKETNFLDTGLSASNADEFRTSYRLIDDALTLRDAFITVGKADTEVVAFINDIWSLFKLEELNWRRIVELQSYSDDASQNDKELEFLGALAHIEIFPRLRSSDVFVNGNKNHGYFNWYEFDWQAQDDFIGEYLASGVQSNKVAWKLLQYRVGTETWAYHCQCMGAYAELMKGKTNLLAQQKSLIDGYDEVAEKYYFKQTDIAIATAKSMVMGKLSRYFTVFVVAVGAAWFGIETDIEWLLFLSIGVVALALLRLLYQFIKGALSGFLARFSNKGAHATSNSLVLLADMKLFCLQLEESSIDLEGVAIELRRLRNKGAAYPANLIGIIRSYTSNGVFHFDYHNTRR